MHLVSKILFVLILVFVFIEAKYISMFDIKNKEVLSQLEKSVKNAEKKANEKSHYCLKIGFANKLKLNYDDISHPEEFLNPGLGAVFALNRSRCYEKESKNYTYALAGIIYFKKNSGMDHEKESSALALMGIGVVQDEEFRILYNRLSPETKQELHDIVGDKPFDARFIADQLQKERKKRQAK